MHGVRHMCGSKKLVVSQHPYDPPSAIGDNPCVTRCPIVRGIAECDSCLERRCRHKGVTDVEDLWRAHDHLSAHTHCRTDIACSRL